MTVVNRTAAVVAIVTAALWWAACDMTITFEPEKCYTPVPIFQVDSTSAVDSVALGCPYGFVDDSGKIHIVNPLGE